MKIVIAIFIFCFIVFFHELGHFLIAKKNNIFVREFSIGFGPRLLHFKKGETEYCLKLIPFGGSCMMDEDEGESDDPRAFVNASVWARMAVILGGPVFNLILAFILAVVLVGLSGYDAPVVSGVVEGLPAKEAGLLPGDEIIRINNHRTHFFRDVSVYLALHDGQEVTVTYKRDGETLTSLITPVYKAEDERYYIGINGGAFEKGSNAFEVIKYSFYEVEYWVYITFKSVCMLVTGNVSLNDLSGPVGIVNTVSETYESSVSYGVRYVFINMVNIAVLLTANLGVMNLLPVPALDGGRFVFLLVEAITKKKPVPKVEAAINGAGMVALFGLMFFIMFNDVRKLFM